VPKCPGGSQAGRNHLLLVLALVPGAMRMIQGVATGLEEPAAN